jgi:tetratricopeptide (TPR) repeat protein
MSSQTLACPQCHTALRSNKPVPAAQMVRCPQCGNQFAAGGIQDSPTVIEVISAARPPAASTASPTLILLATAVLISTVVVVGTVAALVYFPRNRGPSGDEQAQLEAERKALAEERESLNTEKRKLDFADLMKKADDALAKKNFDDAVKDYRAALNLFPDDADAKAGLIAAHTGLNVEGKTAEDRTKRRADYAKFMLQGKTALDAKDWAGAAAAYERAIQVMPGDDAANKGLDDARTALAALQNDKAKQGDYQTRMDAGRAAMKAQRYPDAVREFLAALRLVPDDADATKGLQEAEKKLGDIQDLDKRKTEFNRLVDRAKASFKDKRYDDAIDTIQAALKLFPADMEAAAILATARQSRTDARTEYTKLIDKGVFALRSGQFEQAKGFFTDANRLFPDDVSAKNGLRDVQKALDDQAAFVRYMAQAAAASEAQNYSDAVRLYTLATGINPNDVEALREMRRLRKLLEKDVGEAVEFDRQMAIGKAAWDRRDYVGAAAAFKKAVKLSPGDLTAIDLLHQANYQVDIAAAKTATTTKRYREAVRFYEEALQEIPGDQVATNGLDTAKILLRAAEAAGQPGVKTTPKQ